MSIILIVEPPANHTCCIFVNEGSLNNLLYDVIITLVQYIKRRFIYYEALEWREPPPSISRVFITVPILSTTH